MYEENCDPLLHEDASVVFAKQLAEMKLNASATQPANITPESVVRWADPRNETYFAEICRRLLLPGSGIVGSKNLQQLVELAREGSPCVLCLNHRSNLDVPTLFTLLEDHADSDWFRRIVWIAGRKLEEDTGLTSLLIQCFNRVIVTPPSWFAFPRTDDELHEARMINIAADRAVAKLRREGWILGLFPSATRIRPGVESTEQAIEQTDSYLRMFQYLLLCNIDGCTLPVSNEQDFTHETPKLDRMVYTFGLVQSVKEWRGEATSRFPNLDQRMASAHAIREDIEALAPRG
jgi:hypothetical protein